MEKIIEQLERRMEANRFATYNHLELETVERDRVVVRMEIRPESKNPHGIVHGGALYTMADNACGTAAHTDGRTYVTQHGGLNFLTNRNEGVLRAEAKIRRRGKMTCLAAVDITDEAGTLLATGEFLFFCVSETQNFGNQ